MPCVGGLLTLREVAAETRHSVPSVRRWIADGIQGPDGRRVRLAATREGGRVFVARLDLDRFREALNADRAANPPPTAADHRRAAAAASADFWRRHG